MKSHEVYELAMPRGAAGRVATELRYADSSIPKSWRRPVATAFNLFSGRLSPLTKAKAEILAHDRVSREEADILLFDIFADVARQRARRIGDNEDAVLAAVISSYHTAIESLFSQTTPELTEQELYRAGAAIVRALLFVIGDDSAGLPLCRTEDAAATRRERVSLGGRLLALVKGKQRGQS